MNTYRCYTAKGRYISRLFFICAASMDEAQELAQMHAGRLAKGVRLIIALHNPEIPA